MMGRHVSSARQLGTSGDRVPWRRQALTAVAAVTVIAFAVSGCALFSPPTATPPANLGWYRVLPPSRFEGGVLSGTSQSSVWTAGIRRFSDAVPVSVVYDDSGVPWLTQHNLPTASQVIDDEPTGPLEGYLQCSETLVTCAWADYSGIIVVSQAPPSEFNWLAQFTTGPAGIYGEQTLAGLTQSFRGTAELLRHKLPRTRQESLPTGTPRQRVSPPGCGRRRRRR